MSESMLFGLKDLPQVADESNDEVYYELGRFMELAAKNNPNILELLATPSKHIIHQHPVFEEFLPPGLFLSKRCEQTFGRYAMAQIKKARGLNKKVVNPMPLERKTILDFCYVLVDEGSRPLLDWLAEKGLAQDQCGLSKVPNAKDVYALFIDRDGNLDYSGISGKPNSNAVRLSSIPKEELFTSHVVYHADGYSQHCRAHREYWAWVEKRNDHRYKSTVSHGGGYDSKNMMHTFRLLDMAVEILRDGEIQVERSNRDELLAIKRGEFKYEDLLVRANNMLAKVEDAAAHSKLPLEPDMFKIERALINTRRSIYASV